MGDRVLNPPLRHRITDISLVDYDITTEVCDAMS